MTTLPQEKPFKPKFRLFEAYGVELEYMIVDHKTLDVLPITDQLLHSVLGEYLGNYEKDPIGWSNELALHVLELKTTTPVQSLEHISEDFQQEVKDINHRLIPFGGQLMPTAMHPWMNPTKEMKLWTHDNSPIYATFNRIFNCQGHGWSNLQSNHLNLSFGNEEEFVRLHAAIRLILPLIPALAASSPIVEGKVTGMLDTRLNVYRMNSAKIPSITGHIIPEVCLSFEDYRTKIFKRIYKDIAPYDPEKILQDEWLNARGAITRFNRYAIEIRVIDLQECPEADVGVSRAITEVIKYLVQEKWVNIEFLHQFHEERLKEILLETMISGEKTMLEDKHFLEVFGWKKSSKCTAKDLWIHLSEACGFSKDPALKHILTQGTLSTRILKALGSNFGRPELADVYRELCQNLETGSLF